MKKTRKPVAAFLFWFELVVYKKISDASGKADNSGRNKTRFIFRR